MRIIISSHPRLKAEAHNGVKPVSMRLSQLVTTYWAYAAALVVRGLELVGKFGLYMLAARILGAHESGLFFLCMTWIGLVATISRAGFEKAIIRHMAGEMALGRTRDARRAMLTGLGWTTLGGVLATGLTILFAEPLSIHLFSEPDLVLPLKIAAAVILPQALCVVVGSALSGYHRVVAAQFIQNGLWPIVTLAAVGLGARSLNAMLMALGASYVVAILVGVGLILMQKPAEQVQGDLVPDALPALWRTAIPLGIVEVVQMSLNSIPVLVLGVFGTPTDVGAFSVANRISLLISVLVVSIGTIAAPSFASLHRRGEIVALRALNRRVRLVVALCGVPAIAVMLLAPVQLLHLIGPGFEIGASALMVMSIGQLVYCLFPNQDIVLAMTGHGNVLRWLNIAQFVTCCALAFALIPPFGMMGAAVLACIVVSQGALGTAIALRRLLPAAY
ncbi:oligosaccharide flippase family protein [Xanthobacter sp. DSM 24535]|uniref:lipopolysaccharide biosynthesis protein n=1 Tax=Roseixanthobacter psychrophilus TaxID=3119917 RepID=UPI003729B91C